MDMAEHARLLRQAMGGDHGAFEALVDAHRVKLTACIKVRLGAGQCHADDVFQEATLAAWQSLSRFRHESGAFEAWFLRIGIHKAFDKLRQLAGQFGQGPGQNADATSSVPGISQIPAAQTTPSKIVSRQERDALLDQAVQQLDERQRMGVEVHLLEGFSNAETAEMMSLILETTITEGQVKNYVRQGLKRLQELLPRESAIWTDVAPKAEKK